MGSQSIILDSAGIGKGFFGDLLLAYALKKAIKLNSNSQTICCRTSMSTIPTDGLF
jgi:hypothetical protein